MTWLPSFASCVLSCRSAWPVFPLSFPLGFKLKSHLPVFLISQSQIQDWNAQYTVIYSLSISVSVRESSMWGPREPCCPALKPAAWSHWLDWHQVLYYLPSEESVDFNTICLLFYTLDTLSSRLLWFDTLFFKCRPWTVAIINMIFCVINWSIDYCEIVI